MYDVGTSAARPANSVTRGGAAWWKVELEEGLASSHLGVERIGTVRSDFGSTLLLYDLLPSCPVPASSAETLAVKMRYSTHPISFR